MTRKELHEMVMSIDPVNSQFILADPEVLEHADRSEEYREKGSENLLNYYTERVEKMVREYDRRHLLPSNAKVGEGATVVLYSDRHAGTIVKVTPTTIVIRRDKATLDPEFKPEWITGGFAGHCTNQSDQTYTYEPDPNGETYKFHWSKKYRSYGQPGDLRAIKGRHEFYDYNF